MLEIPDNLLKKYLNLINPLEPVNTNRLNSEYSETILPL
jgi:hypothetical protein